MKDPSLTLRMTWTVQSDREDRREPEDGSGGQWTVQEDREERRWTERSEGGQRGERDVKLSC